MCVEEMLGGGRSHSTVSKDDGWEHDADAQILSQRTARSLQPWELGPPEVSDGLQKFSWWTVEAMLCGSPFISATNEVEIHGLWHSSFHR